MMMFIDRYYLILVLPALLLAFWAQANVSHTFERYARVQNLRGFTGAQIARRILDQNGLYQIPVEHIGGNLTDHYDPRANVVRLSDSVYNSTSVAAVGVAAHEVGHAIQHAQGYFPIKIRMAIIPITNLGSKLSIPLVLLGFILGMTPLVNVGILLFATMTVFQLVTLPVEFNASSRALVTLNEMELLGSEELGGARKVLRAAALTYVAALIVSVANLLRLIAVFGRRRQD